MSPYLDRPLRSYNEALADIRRARRAAERPRGMTLRHEIAFFLALSFLAAVMVYAEQRATVSPELEAAAARVVGELRP